MKLALSHPDRFAAAASLSGVLDLPDLDMSSEDDPQLLHRVFGERALAGSDDDLFALLGALTPDTVPPLYACCGTEDGLIIDGNRRFVAECERRGVALQADIGPGDHEWGYWDQRIQDVLAWLPGLSDR